MILGIDIGLDGAIVVFKSGNPVAVIEMPTMADSYGSKPNARQINCAALHDEIDHVRALWNEPIQSAWLERISAMPGQGVTSMFRLGASFGAVLGVLGALKIPVQLVRPQEWKKYYGLLKAPKDMSRTKAVQKFPTLAYRMRRRCDHNLADAVLIGNYGIYRESKEGSNGC